MTSEQFRGAERDADRLRVGDAERDEVTSALHEHFAQGRLTRNELDERLTATLSARTVGDLRNVTRDLPGTNDLAPVRRPHGPWRGRGPWEIGTMHWGRGPMTSPWPRGGWGPPRGRPFGPLLLVALIVGAFTGWWVIFPLLAFVWFTAAFTGLRHARHHRRAWLSSRR
jgi:uncharacterized membrane protein